MRLSHWMLCVTCAVCAPACAPIDDDGQAVDLIVVEGEPAALLTTPAANSRLDGALDPSELQPLPGAPPPGRGAQYNLETEIRDCTFQERANAAAGCPPGKLLGACTVEFEEWADGSIHVSATLAYCSIDAAPSSGSH